MDGRQRAGIQAKNARGPRFEMYANARDESAPPRDGIHKYTKEGRHGERSRRRKRRRQRRGVVCGPGITPTATGTARWQACCYLFPSSEDVCTDAALRSDVEWPSGAPRECKNRSFASWWSRKHFSRHPSAEWRGGREEGAGLGVRIPFSAVDVVWTSDGFRRRPRRGAEARNAAPAVDIADAYSMSDRSSP